jgi:hypothetical protein
MIELLFGLAVGLLIGIKMKLRIKKQRRVRSANAAEIKIPFDLGIKKDVSYSNELNYLSQQLENALDSTYLEHVKNRVIANNLWSEKEFELYLYGLKQYFLLNAVLKTVPMFSKEVYIIWHEMLMFTREYEDFCNRYIGEMIHHVPSIGKDRMEDEVKRAEFDWLYSQFFEVNEVSNYIFKKFYLFKMDKNKIAQLEKWTVEEIQSFYFKVNLTLETIAKTISSNLKMQIELAQKQKGNPSLKSLGYNYNDDNLMIFSLFVDDQKDHKHHSDSYQSSHPHTAHHHSDSTNHHSCSSHSCSSHSCSSCSSCSS